MKNVQPYSKELVLPFFALTSKYIVPTLYQDIYVSSISLYIVNSNYYPCVCVSVSVLLSMCIIVDNNEVLGRM